MKHRPVIWGLHAQPTRRYRIYLGVLPFVLLAVIYLVASDVRLSANSADKLLPSVAQMTDAVERMAFTENTRTGDYLFWTDTGSSLRRLFLGVGFAAVIAFWLGLNMGLYRGFSALTNPFITFVSMIPPLAILPILFITFGLGELGKIVLIFLGTFPVITRDIYIAVRKVPAEQIVKALTLGASPAAVIYRIIMPQLVPRLLEAIRLSLGAAWLFLIAAEAIASTDGLGYRIFLVRRYLSMDVIIPYVLWITALGYFMDFMLLQILKRRYKWYSQQD
jgi:NitT/TauT family transport system permease protein